MAVTASARSSSDFRFSADSEIQRIISERIEDRKQGVGIVVGLVGPEGRRIVACGHFGTDDPRGNGHRPKFIRWLCWPLSFATGLHPNCNAGRRSSLRASENLEFFPEGEQDFFSKGVDAQITFEVDGKGHVGSLVLHLDGQRMPA